MSEIRLYELTCIATGKDGKPTEHIRKEWAYSVVDALQQVILNLNGELRQHRDPALEIQVTHIGPPREHVEKASKAMLDALENLMNLALRQRGVSRTPPRGGR